MSRTAEPSMERRDYDVVVIGAGVAGLAFTLHLPPGLKVALLTKGVLGESNTRYAQGGLSAAVGPDDSPALHLADTLAAGAGLCDLAAVERLVEGAPEAVAWLIGIGTQFDAGPDGTPLLGREAAHSRRRVLHAGGDATGAEIERALVRRVREDPGIDVFAKAFAIDLVLDAGRCVGVTALLDGAAAPVCLAAPFTVLAAGGAGQLWATTSNPPGATADGLAMALRAGVPVADLEFVQFHPTVLTLDGSDPFLVSEAVRGEGAYLRNLAGERFMEHAHPLAELAPRDVVARGIQRQLTEGDGKVFLDLRHLDPDAMRARFPTISEQLAKRGLDLATDLIPVAPASHYFIGGVAAATDGETGLPGLLAIGEASCTGIHGANRLASNSLLEGLVFGIDTARRVAARAATADPPPSDLPMPAADHDALPAPAEVAALRDRLQESMSRHVAVVRDAAGLTTARRELAAISDALPTVGSLASSRRDLWELRNMVLSASAVVAAALDREESRGAHFRSDFPAPDPALDGRHTLLLDGTWQDGPLEAAWLPRN